MECTVHSTKYHCLIRLRSSGSPAIAEITTATPSITNDDTTTATTAKETTKGNTTSDSDNRVIKPDISSLVVVPIRERRSHNVEEERCVKRSRTVNNNVGDYITNSSMIIPLLPTLYFDTHCNTATNNFTHGGLLKSNNVYTNCNGTNDSCIDDDHPCFVLVNIAHQLQDQLKERLTDASNGNATNAPAATATAASSMVQNNTRHRREGGISSATMQEEFLL